MERVTQLLIVSGLVMTALAGVGLGLARAAVGVDHSQPALVEATLGAADVTPTTNLTVSTATYLGGSGNDQLNAVDMAPDKTVVVGGQLPGHNPGGATPTALLGGGDGAVVRFDSTGKTVLSVTRIGSVVYDLEVNAGGVIAVCGDFGVAVLASTAGSLAWNAAPGSVSRCAINDNGEVVALSSDTIYAYDNGGNQQGMWNSGSSARHYHDVAIDANRVFVTGYDQKAADLKVAFLQAFNPNGSLQWTSYDFSASAAKSANLGADTEGERVAVGRDGQLYLAATINGGTGASIFAKDPKDITKSSNLITTDKYNNPFNVGSVTLTWYGRFDPASGNIDMGQTLLTRLSSGKGNSIAPRAIMADENGRLYLAGDKWADLDNRSARQISSQPVGNYSGGEAYLLVVSPDFTQRIVWTPWAATGLSAGSSPATGVSVRGGTAAMAATLDDDTTRQHITVNALQASRSASEDGYLAVWPQVGVDAPPNAVTLTGPAVGFVATANTFTAVVEPSTAALPITFTWKINGVQVRQVSLNQRSDTYTYSPAAASNVQIQVTAANSLGEQANNVTLNFVIPKKTFLPVVLKEN